MAVAETDQIASSSTADRAAGLARAQWTVGVLFAASAVLLGFWARLPVPYRDDWDWFRWLLGASSISAYFVPHNEHVIPIARLLLQLQFRLEGSSGYTMLVAALASVGVIVWLTLDEVRRRWPDDAPTRASAGGVVLVILCFAWQLQSVVFPAAVLFPLVQMFAVAALTCLLNAGETQAGVRAGWLVLSWLLAGCAMLTTTNGLPVPLMLALIAAGRRMGWGVVAGFVAMAAGAAALYVAWVLPAGGGPLGTLPAASLAVGFFLAFFASVLALATPFGAVVVGGMVFVAGVYVVVTTWWRGPRPRLEHFAAGLLLFTMASAALAAPTRADFGIVQVAQSRYASFVQPYWAALVLVGLSRLPAERRRRLAAPALAVSFAAAGAQAVIGAVWIAKADNVAAAGLALRAGGGDHEWMLTLYPAVDVPRHTADALAARGDTSLGGGPPSVSATAVSAGGRCEGRVELVQAPVGPGLRMRGHLTTPAVRGVLLDRTGHSVGLARPAPVVDAPNPSPLNVARAVARAWTTASPTEPRWLGFAEPGAGPPFVLVILGGDSRPTCTLEVTGP